MRHIAISERHRDRRPRMIAAAFWIIVGFVAMIVFGDTLALLALALAFAAMAWWIWREVAHLMKSHDAPPSVRGVGSRAGH